MDLLIIIVIVAVLAAFFGHWLRGASDRAAADTRSLMLDALGATDEDYAEINAHRLGVHIGLAAEDSRCPACRYEAHLDAQESRSGQPTSAAVSALGRGVEDTQKTWLPSFPIAPGQSIEEAVLEAGISPAYAGHIADHARGEHIHAPQPHLCAVCGDFLPPMAAVGERQAYEQMQAHREGSHRDHAQNPSGACPFCAQAEPWQPDEQDAASWRARREHRAGLHDPSRPKDYSNCIQCSERAEGTN